MISSRDNENHLYPVDQHKGCHVFCVCTKKKRLGIAALQVVVKLENNGVDIQYATFFWRPYPLVQCDKSQGTNYGS
jgi:hypothetical protein